MKLPEAYRGLAKTARKSGWLITRRPGGHLCWRSPSGEVVITSATPGGPRSLRNALAELRRHGLKREG